MSMRRRASKARAGVGLERTPRREDVARVRVEDVAPVRVQGEVAALEALRERAAFDARCLMLTDAGILRARFARSGAPPQRLALALGPAYGSCSVEWTVL